MTSKVYNDFVLQALVMMPGGDHTGNSAAQQCDCHICGQASDLVHCLYIAVDT